MNSIWNKNIQAFKSRFPALANFYHNIIEDINTFGDKKDFFSFWKIIPAKNGSLTAQIDNMLLHSSYNPEREAMSTASQLASKNKETVIFMGAGLGWQFCALAKMINAEKEDCPVKKLILIEPDPFHFFGALFYVDWTAVFEVNQLVIAVGCPEGSIMGLLEGNEISIGNTGVSASYVYAIPSFIQHARPYFDSVIKLIERNRDKNDINAATYKKFEKLWIRNSMKNIVQLGRHRTLTQFVQSTPENKNFVVVAAGPSLEALLPKMPLYKQNAVIVCVETALHALLKNGVEPDYIVITDPQYYAYRHIAGLSAPSSTLICPLSVYPAVFNFKCRQIVICSEMFPVSSYFEKQLGSFGDLGAGGSVASSAWNLCRMLGADNIYFAGLDLSYPEGQTHIKGSSAEQTFHTGSNRLSPVQAYNSSSRFGANPEYAQDYNGNQVLTDARMKMFAWWFESKIATCPEVKTYTLSTSSMKIPGVLVAEKDPFEDADTANKSVVPEQKTVVPEQKTVVPEPVEGKTLTSDISLFYNDLKELTALINQAVEKCIIGGPELQTTLEQIDSKIKASPLAEIVRLANPAVTDKLEAYRQLQKTMEIYNKYTI
ncbi:MAG: motility associated factor glycosyltransferase family protein [Treponema sp.]|nr:motility associated factor glycosyltransferase family protein [Treponema sp.]